MLAYSPLYALTSASGITLEQRIADESIPAEYIFEPTVIPPTIEVKSPKVIETVVDDFKYAIQNSDYRGVLASLTEVYTDKTLLMRCLIESAIEYINDGAPPVVDLIISVTYAGMDAETVMSVISLLMRTSRSAGYPEYVADALEYVRDIPADVALALLGDAVLEGEYEKLAVCDQRYWAYPLFVRYTNLDVTKPPVSLPGLTGGARKKARELEALD